MGKKEIQRFEDDDILHKVAAGDSSNYDEDYGINCLDEFEIENPELAAQCRQMGPKIFSNKPSKKPRNFSKYLDR